MDERIFGFAPICGENARVLILGSMPSVASLQKQQYYGHPQNAFWKILFALFGEPFTTDYAVRTDLLLRHRIALWDSAASCIREGSLDSSITDAVPNDIPGLLRNHPGIGHIYCNGHASYQMLMRFHRELKTQLPVTQLISTSPAAATATFEQKLERWSIVLEQLSQEV